MYTITKDAAIRRADGAHIPADKCNRDYRAFLDWEAAGNVAAVEQEDPADAIKARLCELDATISRQNEDLISALEASGVTIKDKLYPAMAGAMAEKQKLRGELGEIINV